MILHFIHWTFNIKIKKAMLTVMCHLESLIHISELGIGCVCVLTFHQCCLCCGCLTNVWSQHCVSVCILAHMIRIRCVSVWQQLIRYWYETSPLNNTTLKTVDSIACYIFRTSSARGIITRLIRLQFLSLFLYHFMCALRCIFMHACTYV